MVKNENVERILNSIDEWNYDSVWGRGEPTPAFQHIKSGEIFYEEKFGGKKEKWLGGKENIILIEEKIIEKKEKATPLAVRLENRIEGEQNFFFFYDKNAQKEFPLHKLDNDYIAKLIDQCKFPLPYYNLNLFTQESFEKIEGLISIKDYKFWNELLKNDIEKVKIKESKWKKFGIDWDVVLIGSIIFIIGIFIIKYLWEKINQ